MTRRGSWHAEGRHLFWSLSKLEAEAIAGKLLWSQVCDDLLNIGLKKALNSKNDQSSVIQWWILTGNSFLLVFHCNYLSVLYGLQNVANIGQKMFFFLVSAY